MSSLLFLDLNQDVLLHIAASLPRPTLAILSSGCRALRNLYSVHLLDGCVTVTTDTLLSFRSFLDADPTRLQYLRRLQFTGWGPDLRTLILLRMGFHPEQPIPKVDTGKHVMEILRMAHSLNFLSLLDMDTELFPPAELKSTLARLPLLEHLYLGQTEDVHQDLIADILPNLRSVISQFRFIDRRIGNEDLETYHAFPGLPPLPLLRSHTNVLQSLSLCWVHLPRNLPPFPNVRCLELSLWSAPGGLRTLLTAFPNVEDLTIGPPRVSTVLDGSIFIQGEEQAATAEAQRASNRTLTSQWSRIRRIACVNALALYWLGLQYAVDQVEVREIDATSRMLETILNDLRPRCLTLLTHSRLMNLFVDPSKRTLNLLPQAPYVTHLVQLARVDRRERVRVLVSFDYYCILPMQLYPSLTSCLFSPS